MKRAARKHDEDLRLDALRAIERELHAGGSQFVAGVDEVGAGPLAGPVLAAAVLLPADVVIRGVDDSKRLSATRRVALAHEIRAKALAVAFGVCEVDEIDRLNIYHASLEAMRRAVTGLAVVPQHVLVDARRIPGISIAQTGIVKGDARCHAIACASVVAKVERDQRMDALAARHPGYGFEKHKGYGTARHMEALAKLGPTSVHRRSFAPVARLYAAAQEGARASATDGLR